MQTQWSPYRVKYIGTQRHGFLWLKKSRTWIVQYDNGLEYGWYTLATFRSCWEAEEEMARYKRSPC